MNKGIYNTVILSVAFFMAVAICPARASASELMLSGDPERSSPVTLDGNLISGDVFIYLAHTNSIKQVLFYLDDPAMSEAPIKAEYLDSYDFAGTDQITGKAYPYDSTRLEPGNHNITARIDFSDGSTEIAQATFKYFPPDAPLALISNAELVVSATADRASPMALDGTSVTGVVYIHIAQVSGVKHVAFYLDDPDMVQVPMRTEYFQAYDFAGTDESKGNAYPFDLSGLALGSHTITAMVTFSDDSFRSIRAEFNQNLGAVPTPSALPTPRPSTAPAPVQRVGKKWNPGHYLNAYWGTDMPGSLGRVKPHEFLKGVSVIHQWRELEPTKGSYNFTRIESELALAKAANKQLMVQINDRTFWKNWPDCVPDYVRNDPLYMGGQSHYGVKCTALRWVPQVQDRLIALYKALGSRFNKESNFEAIFVEEDGVELRGDNMAQYTARGYTDQEKRGMDALALAFPNTQVFKFLSWGPNVGELFSYAEKLGLGVGGPDLVPEDNTFATPYYSQYAGRIPLEISSQDPRVKQYIDQGGTVERMIDFAITDPNGLHVNYIIWDQPEYSTLSYKRNILPLLKDKNGLINGNCPLNLVCQ